MPTTEDATARYVDGRYLRENPDWHDGEAEWKFAQVLPLLRLVEFDTIADVGCGTGGVLELVGRHFPEAELAGFDISPALEPFWRERSGRIRFHRGHLTEREDRFDVLLLLDVFEHVDDYMGLLRELRSRGRHFVFHIPLDIYVLSALVDDMGRKRREVGHLHYFSISTALATLEDCGYRLVEKRMTRSGFRGHTKHTRRLKLVRTVGEKLFGPELNARILGGYSLAVLATAE